MDIDMSILRMLEREKEISFDVLVEAIEQSCDIHFYDVARRTGIDRIGQMARRLGLGKQLGLGLNGERPGLVPSREWKLALGGEPWQQGETLITGIGQKDKQPIAWSNAYNGGRAFYTSMGFPLDFENENFRRLMLNAIEWTTQKKIIKR